MTLRDIYRWNPLLATVGWFNAGLLAVALIALPFDNRLILGANPWIKPIKFDVSVIVYAFTVAWYLAQLPQSRAVRIIAGLIAASMIVENVLVTLQSARGVASHFNVGNPLDGAVFGTMGIFIVINTLAVVWILVLYLRSGVTLPPAVLLGARLGLVLFLFSSFEGGVMISRLSHTVGGPDGGPGLPFLTWSTQFGDLRWAHFIPMHGLQLLPLSAWLLGRKPLVAAVFAAVLALTIATLAIALQGRPLIAL